MARAAAAYYAGPDPFGRAGDFTTAPEISQAFGECLGLWAAVTWQAMGSPAPVVLAELGPGRGTLMADALRAIGEVMPAFRAALSVHLVETSPALRAAQALAVPDAQWHAGIEGLPAGPAIILANEFFDALPIRQFIRRADGWRERFVQDGRWQEQPPEAAPPLPEPAPEGTVLEHCAAALGIAAALAARGATLLALDYGPAEDGFGDSLQALAAHGRADPLAPPGSVDITAHVRFAALAAAARSQAPPCMARCPWGCSCSASG